MGMLAGSDTERSFDALSRGELYGCDVYGSGTQLNPLCSART
jgi:hypothetical protein